MKFKPNNPFRTLLTGLLAMLPLVATLLLLAWTWQFVAEWLGPDSAFGRLLTRVGLGVATTEVTGYLAGLVLLTACVYALGLLVEAGLERGLARMVNFIMHRIPVVRTVYDVSSKLVSLFAKPEKDGLKSMSAVWLHFGGKGSEKTTVLLGLLSTSVPVMIGGQAFHAVLVPTAPVPIGGGLLYVPADWVEPADMGMEGVTSIYVSMGVTSSQYIK
ncbi:MAG: DUF502 domain-containing protein [Comamonadaceae bacterium]|nr:MAG: DUF502 domain-containing protein [Comamonadaceae bacterium]